MTELEAAWAAVHEDTPEGRSVGQPIEHPERAEWSQYAFDPSETPIVGKRSRVRTVVMRMMRARPTPGRSPYAGSGRRGAAGK